MVESLIRLGYLPPFPFGCRTMGELRDRSVQECKTYLSNFQKIVSKPVGGKNAEGAILVGLFEEWLLHTGEKL